MQNLFINPKDEFVVKFSVAIDKDNTVFCDLEKKSLISLLESMKKKVSDFSIEEYQATFKKPSFGDTMTMYGEIFSMNEEGVSFNPIVTRYNKISTLIKSWNLKGDIKKPTNEEIKQLHPVIASVIGIVVDIETGGILN